jgi:hypothetical protein
VVVERPDGRLGSGADLARNLRRVADVGVHRRCGSARVFKTNSTSFLSPRC